MLTRIVGAADKALELKFDSSRSMMLELARRQGFTWDGRQAGAPIEARIDFGRWLVDCECRNAFYVDPADPVFFCPSCGNAAQGGALRSVVFPPDREAIERELLKRPVEEPVGMTPVNTALNSSSLVPGLSRSWRPGESVAVLKEQRLMAIKAGKD